MNKVIKRSIYIFLNLLIIFGIFAPYLFSFHPDQAVAWGMELAVAKVIADIVVLIGIAVVIFDGWHIIAYASRTYGMAMRIKKEDIKRQYGLENTKEEKSDSKESK